MQREVELVPGPPQGTSTLPHAITDAVAQCQQLWLVGQSFDVSRSLLDDACPAREDEPPFDTDAAMDFRLLGSDTQITVVRGISPVEMDTSVDPPPQPARPVPLVPTATPKSARSIRPQVLGNSSKRPPGRHRDSTSLRSPTRVESHLRVTSPPGEQAIAIPDSPDPMDVIVSGDPPVAKAVSPGPIFCQKVVWTAPEIALFKVLFGIHGRKWVLIDKLMLNRKSVHELYTYWRDSGGFAAAVPDGSEFRMDVECAVCHEDAAFSGAVERCQACGRHVHPSCVERPPRREQQVAWFCSVACRDESGSALSPRLGALSPFSLLPFSPIAAAATAAVTWGTVLLCKEPGCSPSVKATRFRFRENPTEGPFYGVRGNSVNNIIRHFHDRHGLKRTDQTADITQLLSQGRVERVAGDKLIMLPQQIKYKAGDDSRSVQSEDSCTWELDEEVSHITSSSQRTVPSLSLASSARESATATPVTNPSPVGSATDDPQEAITAVVRAVLRRARWGARCSSCFACESPHVAPLADEGTVTVCHAPIFGTLPAAALSQTLRSEELVSIACEQLWRTLSEVSKSVRGLLNRGCIGSGGNVPVGANPKNAWVLSLQSAVVDTDATLAPGREIAWPCGKYLEIRAGDAVFFWRIASENDGADESGVVAVGRVLSGPRLVPESGVVRMGAVSTPDQQKLAYRVRVRVDSLLQEPLPSSRLRRSPALACKNVEAVAALNVTSLTANQTSALFENLRKFSTTVVPSESGRLQAVQLLHELLAASESNHAAVEISLAEPLASSRHAGAIAWLVQTRRIAQCSGHVAGAAPLPLPTFRIVGGRNVSNLACSLAEEARTLARTPAAPGVCQACGISGGDLVLCASMCGAARHRCCFDVPPSSLDFRWFCDDCHFATIDLESCSICNYSTADEASITCDCCSGWFHFSCLGILAGKDYVPPALWLCPRCRISESQAARCELYLGCCEASSQTVSLLGSIADRLCNAHRESAKGCPVVDVQRKMEALANTISRAREVVSTAANVVISEWATDVEQFYTQAHMQRMAKESSIVTEGVKQRRNKRPDCANGSADRTPGVSKQRRRRISNEDADEQCTPPTS